MTVSSGAALALEQREPVEILQGHRVGHLVAQGRGGDVEPVQVHLRTTRALKEWRVNVDDQWCFERKMIF